VVAACAHAGDSDGALAGAAGAVSLADLRDVGDQYTGGGRRRQARRERSSADDLARLELAAEDIRAPPGRPPPAPSALPPGGAPRHSPPGLTTRSAAAG